MRGSRNLTPDQIAERIIRRVRLGRAIAAQRKALGLTQREVGEHLGLGDKSICAIERGLKWPLLQDALEWSTILRVEPSWFVERQVRG